MLKIRTSRITISHYLAPYWPLLTTYWYLTDTLLTPYWHPTDPLLIPNWPPTDPLLTLLLTEGACLRFNKANKKTWCTIKRTYGILKKRCHDLQTWMRETTWTKPPSLSSVHNLWILLRDNSDVELHSMTDGNSY